MPSPFIYNVTATSNGLLNLQVLSADILASSIGRAPIDPSASKDFDTGIWTFSLSFSPDLTTGEESTLNALVAAHDGSETVEEGAATETLTQNDLNVANGVAALDAGGKISVAQIPAIAVPSVSVVADAAARLALTVQEGDEAIQLDDGSNWIYDGTTWQLRPSGSGDLAGPGSSTDNGIPRFDGTTGKVLQSGQIVEDDSGNVTTGGNVNGRNIGTDGTKLDGIESNATQDQSAAEVPFTPAGDIAANNVQSAITEVRDDTDTKLSGKLDTAHEGAGGAVHAEATTSVPGFLSVADKLKLDSVAERLRITVTQPGHVFTLTNNVPVPAYKNGLGLWVPSQANSANTLCAMHVVEVPDANTIVLQQLGLITATGHSLVIGEYYFLDANSAGAITPIEPMSGLSEVLWYVVDANTLLLMDNRAIDLDSINKFQATLRNTDTSTDINNSSYTEIPMGGNQARNDDDLYTFVGNGIQVTKAGTYVAKCSLHINANVTRANLLVRFFINDAGNGVGAVAASGYIRNGSGHNESSFQLEEDFILAVGDIVTVKAIREAAAGTVSMAVAESSYLKLVKQ